eukprot:3937210-Rhodomonas_salina.1
MRACRTGHSAIKRQLCTAKSKTKKKRALVQTALRLRFLVIKHSRIVFDFGFGWRREALYLTLSVSPPPSTAHTPSPSAFRPSIFAHRRGKLSQHRTRETQSSSNDSTQCRRQQHQLHPVQSQSRKPQTDFIKRKPNPALSSPESSEMGVGSGESQRILGGGTWKLTQTGSDRCRLAPHRT